MLLAQQALEEIRVLRAKLVLLDLQARPGLLGLPDRLVLKACRAFLARWEQREQRALRAP